MGNRLEQVDFSERSCLGSPAWFSLGSVVSPLGPLLSQPPPVEGFWGCMTCSPRPTLGDSCVLAVHPLCFFVAPLASLGDPESVQRTLALFRHRTPLDWLLLLKDCPTPVSFLKGCSHLFDEPLCLVSESHAWPLERSLSRFDSGSAGLRFFVLVSVGRLNFRGVVSE